MNRKLFLLVVLLACLALPLGHLAAQEPAPQAAESEPNHTIATADPIALGDTTANINPIGDVDIFRLSLTAGQRVYVAAITGCYPNELETQLAVYDADGNLVAEPGDEHDGWPGNHVLRFVAPATANYFVRVFSDGYEYDPEELAGPYTLLVRNVPADEPADPFEPVPAAWNTTIDAALFAPYDFDWYRIHARAGDVFQLSLTMDTLITPDAHVRIDDANDTYPYASVGWLYDPGTTNVTYVVPFEADYIIRVANGIFFCDAESYGAQPYRLTITRHSLYVGGAQASKVNGVPFGPNDVLARDLAGAWRMVFDGEDVGLTKPLGGVEFMDDGSLLLSLNVAQALPGLGAVKPTDIVRFVPTQLGVHTQGAFSFYLRGAQAGLTTQGERIDAIALTGDGRLIVSTYGSAGVPRFGGGTLSARDEDMMLFYPNGEMPSAGDWELWLDGTVTLGSRFSANDLRAATLIADPYETDGYIAPLLFTADRAYRYDAWGADGNYQSVTAAPGDVVRLWFDADAPTYPSFWPPIRRTTTLAFPRLISSLSIGPDWNN